MMSKAGVDAMLKYSFSSFEQKHKIEGSGCLSDAELADYITNILADEPVKESLREHVDECDSCFSKVASAVSAMNSFDKSGPEGVDKKLINKVKSIPRLYPGKKRGAMKRNLHLLIAGGFFMLSFVFKAYFVQFLVAALIFGFKWVMDTGGSKALIMIYDAWQRQKDTEDKDKKSRLPEGREMF